MLNKGGGGGGGVTFKLLNNLDSTDTYDSWSS